MGGESRYQTNNPSKQIIIPTRRDFCIDSKKTTKKQQKYVKTYIILILIHLNSIWFCGKKDSSNKLAS